VYRARLNTIRGHRSGIIINRLRIITATQHVSAAVLAHA
jgi:hypothetical protein